MRKRKSEIATILMVGAVVVMGVTAVITSFTQNDKRTTSSRASSCQIGKPGPPGSYICSGNCGVDASGKCPTTSHLSYDKNCKSCNETPLVPTKIPTPKVNATEKIQMYCEDLNPLYTSGTYWIADGVPNAIFMNANTLTKSSYTAAIYCKNQNPNVAATQAPAPTTPPSTSGNLCTNGKAGSGCKWTKDASQGYDITTCQNPNLEFNCCYPNGNRYGCVGTHCSAIGTGSTVVSCKSVPKATPTSVAAGGGVTSGELYPQNDGRTPGMACCFKQGDRVRVYASAASREGSGMNTPCTKAAYGNAYNADDWFECPDTIVGETDVDTYTQLVAASATYTEPTSDKCFYSSTCSQMCHLNSPGWGCTGDNMCCPPGGGSVEVPSGCQQASNTTECNNIEKDMSTGTDYIFNEAEGLCCPKNVEIPAGEPTVTPEVCIPKSRFSACGSGLVSSTSEYIYERIIGNSSVCCKTPPLTPFQGGNSSSMLTPIPNPTADMSKLPNKPNYQKSTCSVECGAGKLPLVDKAIYVKPGGFYIIDGKDVSSLSMCNCIKPTPIPAPGTINKSGRFFNYYSCEKKYDCTIDKSDLCKNNANPNTIETHSVLLSDCLNTCGKGTDCLMGGYRPKPYKPYLYCCQGKF